MLNPIKIVLCNAPDRLMDYCYDANGIRAIGNFHPEFKDEELLIKTCKCNTHKLGECPNQSLWNHIPTLPIYFFKL